MSGKYYFYFDSGTSNTRGYLLSNNFEILSVRKKAIGAKDSAITGSNSVLINGLWELYRETIEDFSISDSDIAGLYASGMVTSPYGLCEISHVDVPISIRAFSETICPFQEDTLFHRTISLVPGLRSIKSDFSFSGTMRGEEIEIFGALDSLKEKRIESAALILPGSHTHIALIRDGTIEDIISTFTGELFYALKEKTLFAPILEGPRPEIDAQMVKLSLQNLTRFGFNRAIQIGHTMKMLDKYTPDQRYSYCEGVINGGVRQVLEHYCDELWQDCHTVGILSDEFMFRLFTELFSDSVHIKNLLWLSIDSNNVYSVKGLKKILTMDRGEQT